MRKSASQEKTVSKRSDRKNRISKENYRALTGVEKSTFGNPSRSKKEKLNLFDTKVPVNVKRVETRHWFKISRDMHCPDEVAEWLWRWTANPMCSARLGSNPVLVDL